MGKTKQGLTNVWGWETSAARLKRYARVSPQCKMEALEEMRLFVVKFGIVKTRSPRLVASQT